MAYADQKMSAGRIWSIVIVALLHALLGYAFVSGLAMRVIEKAREDLKTFDVEEPLPPEELSAHLIADLRHRGVYDRPQFRVSVREYASHAVLVSGLVGDPGTKILRREAVPLYVVVAEAQPKAEAGRAVVFSHATGKTTSIDLNDAAGMAMLVQQGDVINLTARPPEFFYIGGEISAPGQKDFHTGMTLTQAVLASGGVTRLAGARVKVSRQGADGRLVPVEYNLQEIEAGAVPDPAIRAGDRIEVSRAKK